MKLVQSVKFDINTKLRRRRFCVFNTMECRFTLKCWVKYFAL